MGDVIRVNPDLFRVFDTEIVSPYDEWTDVRIKRDGGIGYYNYQREDVMIRPGLLIILEDGYAVAQASWSRCQFTTRTKRAIPDNIDMLPELE